MTTPEELRLAAERYRRIARQITDLPTIAALDELADEYERRADEMDGRAAVGLSSRSAPEADD